MTNSNARARSRPKARQPQRRPKLRGHGDYSDDVKNEVDFANRLEKKIDHLERSLVHATPSVSRAGSMAGRALGSLIGQGDLGALAGESLSKLFGYGDYSMSVKGNSLMAGIGSTVVPKFHGDGKRGIRIMEREFLGNITSGPTLVTGSTTFDNKAYVLNPTDSATFPWLSKIAPLFDQWEPHGIVFEFVSTSSTFNGTSQALGAVVMATDYDAANPNQYLSKQEAENADYACSTVPSANLLHGIECDPRERPTAVLFTSPRSNQLNFSNLGTFQISTQGCSTAGTTLGELWVSYDLTFYKKQLVDPAGIIPELSVQTTVPNGGALIIPGISTIAVNRGFTLTTVAGTGTKVSFPPAQDRGRYLVNFWISNYQTGDIAAAMGVATTNCTVTDAAVSLPTVGANFVDSYVVDINAPGASITVGTKTAVGATVRFLFTAVDPSTNW